MERRAWLQEATPVDDARTTWGSWITAQGPPAAPPHTSLTRAPCGTLGMQEGRKKYQKALYGLKLSNLNFPISRKLIQ